MKNFQHNINSKKQSGFTLLEALITIAILALVLYPIYEFLRQGSLLWQTGENKTEVVQNARIGLDKMCDEIKHASEFYLIEPSQVRFWWKDLNDDNVADGNEILTYYWSGTSGDDLNRKLDSETSFIPLANYVDNLELTYFDQSGSQTTDVAEVYFITATIRTKKTAQGHDYISVMRKSIHPRNI